MKRLEQVIAMLMLLLSVRYGLVAAGEFLRSDPPYLAGFWLLSAGCFWRFAEPLGCFGSGTRA
jgi:hypothetical protein